MLREETKEKLRAIVKALEERLGSNKLLAYGPAWVVDLHVKYVLVRGWPQTPNSCFENVINNTLEAEKFVAGLFEAIQGAKKCPE